MAIISETVILNDKNFTRTHSDAGFYIERNGTLYAEAIDPLGSGREYTETDRLIEAEEQSVEEKISAVSAATEQNSADIQYLAMMSNISLDE